MEIAVDGGWNRCGCDVVGQIFRKLLLSNHGDGLEFSQACHDENKLSQWGMAWLWKRPSLQGLFIYQIQRVINLYWKRNHYTGCNKPKLSNTFMFYAFHNLACKTLFPRSCDAAGLHCETSVHRHTINGCKLDCTWKPFPTVMFDKLIDVESVLNRNVLD